ncbi:MAG: rod-binding protein [Hyphomicrobiales bacterium]
MDAVSAPPSQFTQLRAHTTEHDPIRQKAEEFEAIFLNVMLSSAFEGLGDDDEFGSHATDTWRGLQVEQFANSISESGGIGIADQIYSELLQLQEQSEQ